MTFKWDVCVTAQKQRFAQILFELFSNVIVALRSGQINTGNAKKNPRITKYADDIAFSCTHSIRSPTIVEAFRYQKAK